MNPEGFVVIDLEIQWHSLKETLTQKEKSTLLRITLRLSHGMNVDMSYHVCSSKCCRSPRSADRSSVCKISWVSEGGGGRFWRRSIISNGSGSHNGGTLSDLLGMHCGRQRDFFDLSAYVHRSVPCLKTDPLSDISLP